MKVIVCKNYNEMSKAAADIIKKQVNEKPDSILGLATGSTPIGTYEKLVEMYNNREIDFGKVTTFNLDEYYPISRDSDQSYHYFMNENLFKYVNVDKSRIHIPNGEAENPEEECENYEESVKQSGGIDIQILGIGRNGHIGFNEPDLSLNAKTHLTSLTADTIEANSRFFANEDDVPKHALTMGMSTILSSKKILLLANGTAKHKAISELLSTGITTDNPSTLLKVHPDVTLICDYEAYSDLRIGIDIGGMSVKIGVVDDNRIIDRADLAITSSMTADDITNEIALLCKDFQNKFKISSIGVGAPGIITDGSVYAANLPLKNYPLQEKLSQKLDMPIKLQNDANCAALGELVAGAGKEYNNIVLVTLGTGIGSGIIIDGKIYSGNGAAGEVGHLCIDANGLDCPCGRKGCWEQYASATALIEQVKKAAEKNPDSILANEVNSEAVTGKTLFKALDKGCPVANDVFDKFTDYLAAGIISISNILDTEQILLSGGLSNVGERLLKPLLEKIAPITCVSIAKLKSDAGIIGAAAL